MADSKDFLEDNKERLGQYLDAIATRRRRTGEEMQPPPVVRFCPVCHAAYTSEQDLSRHLLRAHAGQHVYLLVNGSIVRDLAWAQDSTLDISLVLLGHGSADVKVSAPGVTREFQAANQVSVSRHLPKSLEGELRITVTPQGGKVKEFSLFCRSLPEFRSAHLDAVILRLQEDFTRRPAMPDIGAWRAAAGGIARLGALEGRYLNGFYEYTLSFYLEGQRKTVEAKAHFEEAFGNLLPFRTALAHSAQAVLGLRMNCFGVLRRLPAHSPVAAAGAFFNEPYPPAWTVPNDYSPGNPFLTHADEFTIRLTEVVVAYFGKDHARFQRGISALDFHPSSREKNHEDKLALIKARGCRRDGDTDCARRMYDLLRYDPWFGSEADAYLNGTDAISTSR
jgi:hypothetical protein